MEKDKKKDLIAILEREEMAGNEYADTVIHLANNTPKILLLFTKGKDLKRMIDVSSGYKVAYNGANGVANAIKAGTKMSVAGKILGGVGVALSVADIVMTWTLSNDTSVSIGKIIQEKDKKLHKESKELVRLSKTSNDYISQI